MLRGFPNFRAQKFGDLGGDLFPGIFLKKVPGIADQFEPTVWRVGRDLSALRRFEGEILVGKHHQHRHIPRFQAFP